MRKFEGNREEAIYLGAVLLAAGTLAVVSFAAGAGLLQGRRRVTQRPAPGSAVRIARKELRLLTNS